MKHIFTIHSSITFLVAYSIIEHLNLPRQDVILISSKYKVPIEGFTVAPSFAERYAKNLWQKLRYFNVPVNYDRYIDKITGAGPFIAYIDLMSYYQKILVTHKKCKQFHFFEEGNSAYMSEDDDMDLTWEDYTGGMNYRVKYFRRDYFRSLSRVIRGFNLRLISLPYHYMAYTNFPELIFFSLSKNAFYNAHPAKKVLLKPDRAKPAIEKMAGGHALQDAVIWLDGSNARYTGLDEKYYYGAIQKGIQEFRKIGVIEDKVYVKLRPGIKDISKNKLVQILNENDVQVEVLPNDMILECFFMCSRNCKVIGTLTAALEYAHVFGHKVYSIYPFFEKQPPTIFDRMTGFWRNIENTKN
jgi:hypothetical protein